MTRKQRRLILIGASLGVLAVAAALVLSALRDSIVFFNSPTDLAEKHAAAGTRMRIGGLVKPGSIERADNLQIRFAVTDGKTDVAAGEKIPRKGGPGITRSDLLVINKIDLAPLVGAHLEVMRVDALRMRAKQPFIFTNLKSGEGVNQIANFVIEKGGLAKSDSSLWYVAHHRFPGPARP